MIDSSAMPPRHAGEGRYLRLLFVAATKAVDTGLRRHDDVCGAGGSILRIPGIIDPIRWSVLDAQLADSSADGPHIPGIAKREPPDASCDLRLGRGIAERPKPCGKNFRLPDLNHTVL